MILPRFYLPPEEWLLPQPLLQGRDAYHAIHVLRIQVGSALLLFDGRGREARAQVRSIEKKRPYRLELSLHQQRETAPPRVLITLAQALPKAKNMDLIIQKAVELGVGRIIPLLTERTVMRFIDRKSEAEKQERWQQIALEACKQSGQHWLPELQQPCSIFDFLKRSSLAEDQLLFIASLEDPRKSFKEALSSSLLTISGLPAQVTMMIGPEGDFTEEEYQAAREAGFQAVSLGPLVLRTETAALYALSVLSYELLGEE